MLVPMAKVKSLFELSGKMGEVEFYRSWKGEACARRRSGPSSEEWWNSKKMEGSRAYAFAFGGAAKLAARVYQGIPTPMRALMCSYPQNRLTKVICGEMRKWGRLPEQLPGVLAGSALHGLDLGPDEGNALGVELGYSPVDRKISIRRLRACAAGLKRKPSEKVSFRIMYARILVPDIALDDSKRQYRCSAIHTVRGMVVTPWIPAEAVGEGEDVLRWRGPSGEGFDLSETHVMVVGVEWLVEDGKRVRKPKDGVVVRVVGVLRGQSAENDEWLRRDRAVRAEAQKAMLQKRKAELAEVERRRVLGGKGIWEEALRSLERGYEVWEVDGGGG